MPTGKTNTFFGKKGSKRPMRSPTYIVTTPLRLVPLALKRLTISGSQNTLHLRHQRHSRLDTCKGTTALSSLTSARRNFIEHEPAGKSNRSQHAAHDPTTLERLRASPRSQRNTHRIPNSGPRHANVTPEDTITPSPPR